MVDVVSNVAELVYIMVDVMSTFADLNYIIVDVEPNLIDLVSASVGFCGAYN